MLYRSCYSLQNARFLLHYLKFFHQFQMSDRDPGPDDQIGKRETDAAKLKLDGEAILKNFSFGEKVKWDAGEIK